MRVAARGVFKQADLLETRSELKNLLLRLIRAYRKFVSPALPPACRFVPSCSEYACQAIERYGAARGGWLAVKRICRCHPFNSGGYDPVV